MTDDGTDMWSPSAERQDRSSGAALATRQARVPPGTFVGCTPRPEVRHRMHRSDVRRAAVECRSGSLALGRSHDRPDKIRWSSVRARSRAATRAEPSSPRPVPMPAPGRSGPESRHASPSRCGPAADAGHVRRGEHPAHGRIPPAPLDGAIEDEPDRREGMCPSARCEADVVHEPPGDEQGPPSIAARSGSGTPRSVTWATTPPSSDPASIAAPPTLCARPSRLPVKPVPCRRRPAMPPWRRRGT